MWNLVPYVYTDILADLWESVVSTMDRHSWAEYVNSTCEVPEFYIYTPRLRFYFN